MTRQQAMKEAQKRWGKRAMIRAGELLTSPEARASAREVALELRARKQALEAERDARLKALDWLQTMNAEIRELSQQINRQLGEAGHYKFSVGSVDNVLGAFHVKGQGDTWEQAFDAAVGK